MPTKNTKPVTRETSATTFEAGARRLIIVTINPNNTLEVKLKGLRERHVIDVEVLFAFVRRNGQAIKSKGDSQ